MTDNASDGSSSIYLQLIDSMEKEMTKATKKATPVHEIRLGRIRAAVWANKTENGVRHNVTLSRLYKEEDEWRNSTSFGRDDLPLVEKVADIAHRWIFEQSAQQANESEDSAASEVPF